MSDIRSYMSFSGFVRRKLGAAPSIHACKMAQLSCFLISVVRIVSRIQSYQVLRGGNALSRDARMFVIWDREDAALPCVVKLFIHSGAGFISLLRLVLFQIPKFNIAIGMVPHYMIALTKDDNSHA